MACFKSALIDLETHRKDEGNKGEDIIVTLRDWGEWTPLGEATVRSQGMTLGVGNNKTYRQIEIIWSKKVTE